LLQKDMLKYAGNETPKVAFL